LFGQARVLLNTSEAEGFPNAYLQAWRSGTPVVSPVDPDGLILSQGLGRVAERPENLARAVDNLCRRPQRWLIAHERCLRWADEHLNWDRTVDRYEQALIGSQPQAQAEPEAKSKQVLALVHPARKGAP
jgi:glycosyltransferase involved in cell wall biosynthesis